MKKIEYVPINYPSDLTDQETITLPVNALQANIPLDFSNVSRFSPNGTATAENAMGYA